MTGATTLRIAWRNLWRNRRRTGLALAAIALSVALVLAYDGVLRGYGDWMIATITGPMLGHVQVHAPEWRKTREMDKTLTNVDALVGVLRNDPDVTSAHARVYAPALAALGEEGFAVVVMGVEVEAESRPTGLLSNVPARLGPRQVLMGNLLAEQMGVTPGAEIALVGQGVDGSLANDLFTVTALVQTSIDMVNRQAVIMPLAQAQELFAMPGEAHEIVIHARDASTVAALADRLGRMPALAGLEVLDWQRLAPEMVSLVRLVEVAWIIVLVLVLLAAASGVANTMLMATFERTHELGMLLALGTGPGRIVRLIVIESVVLGLIGALIGTAIGVSLVASVHESGIDYAALTGGGPSQISAMGLNWSLRLYPSLAAIDVFRAVGAVVITSVLASAWPAARAARLQPARALRD